MLVGSGRGANAVLRLPWKFEKLALFENLWVGALLEMRVPALFVFQAATTTRWRSIQRSRSLRR